MGRPVQVAKRRRPRRVRLSMPHRGDPLAVKAPAHTNVEKRERGDPAFRPAGQQRLNARERVFADLALAMLRNIPPGAIERYAVDQDDGALAMATALAVAPYEPLIAEALLEQFDESGIVASDEWRREISRAWARVGKEELPDWLSGVPDAPKKPSRVALNYEFDRASPTATKWAKNEAASLVTDITYQQQKAMREVVTRAFTEGRTYGQTASALGQILQEVNPAGEVGQMLASQYAINANGLTPMYANAVARSTQGHAEALLAQGVTGTKALEAVQKKGQRYADKLRRSRAKMISRTEIMRASNQGRLEAANQAAKKGLIDPAAAMRQWISSPMDACPICTDLNGAIVPLNQSWYAGEPPAHPNCRCTWLLVPNVNVQAPPMFSGAGTGDSPFKWSFPAPMKVGDDFLPGAPVVEPVPSTASKVPTTPAEKLEAGIFEVEDYVDAELRVAGLDAVMEGKNAATILDDALVMTDEGVAIMNLGNIIDTAPLNFAEDFTYRAMQLPPRMKSLTDKKSWDDLIWSVRNHYVKRGYIPQGMADEIADAIGTLRDLALGQVNTVSALNPSDLLHYWRALVRVSDTLDKQVRAAISAGAKPPPANSILAKWLARQKTVLDALEAADPAAYASLLQAAQEMSYFASGKAWGLPTPQVGVVTPPPTGWDLVPEPPWWKSHVTGFDDAGYSTSFHSKFGKWADLPPGTQQDLLNQLDNPAASSITDDVAEYLNQLIDDIVAEDLAGEALDLMVDLEAAGSAGAFQGGTDYTQNLLRNHLDSLTSDEVGKWSQTILDPATGTTAVGRARVANLLGDALVPDVYDNVVLPLGMQGFGSKEFSSARTAIEKLVKKGLVSADDALKYGHALEALEDFVKVDLASFSAEAGAARLVDLLQSVTKVNARLHEMLEGWVGAVGVEGVLGKGTRLRKWYDAFDTNLANHADDIDQIVIAKGPLGQIIDDALPWIEDFGDVAPAVAPATPSAAKPKKPAPVAAKPLKDWKKSSMPEEPPFDPKRLIEDKAATASLSGQHPKRVFTDPDTGQQWIFKPQKKWQADLDRATSELQRRLGLQGPETYVVKVDGKIGSIQQVLGGTLDDSVSIFAGKTFDPTKLSSAQMGRMQQNQLLDFLLSNYDSHSDNFLRLRSSADSAMLPIGIDKGQAFKHFAKKGESDGLVNWLFNPNRNAASRNPYGVMLEQFAEGQGVAYNWAADSLELQQVIATARQLADSGELAKILRPYADEAFAAGTLPAKSVDEFIEAVVARWSGLGDEVARLEEKLLQTAGGALRLEQLALAERVADLGLKPASGFNTVTTNWARKELKPATDALTETERRAVQRYTGSYYQKLNAALRDAKGSKSSALNATDAKVVKNLDASMKPLGHDIIVHRGTNHISLPDGSILDPSQAQGKILGDFGYQSSSVGGNAAFGGRVSLEIHVDAGVRAVYAQPISSHTSERELLLQRGLRMYVEKAEKRGNTWHLVVKAIPDETAISGLSEPMVLPIYKEAQLWQMMKAS